jgi:hypothetical protein
MEAGELGKMSRREIIFLCVRPQCCGSGSVKPDLDEMSKFRSCGGSKLIHGELWTSTNGGVEAQIEPWRAMDIHNGGVEAQNETVLGLCTGCCWLLQIRFTLMWM